MYPGKYISYDGMSNIRKYEILVFFVNLTKYGKCKHPAHFCVVGCKERGGGLATVTALTAGGNDYNLIVWSVHEETGGPMVAAVAVQGGAGFKDVTTISKVA